MCRLNLDIDGAPTTYGYDNPAKENSRGEPNRQKSLAPLEAWHYAVWANEWKKWSIGGKKV
jgi:hypothetical protein